MIEVKDKEPDIGRSLLMESLSAAIELLVAYGVDMSKAIHHSDRGV